MMDLKTNRNESTLTITLSGRLDTSTAPELERAVEENLPGVTELIFDLADLTYTSSAGLRVFLKSQKAMSRVGEMKLINVCEAIMEIFELTGFTDILQIEEA